MISRYEDTESNSNCMRKQPFVQHLVSEGHMRQAAAYVPRCEARNRVEWVMEVRMYVLKSAGSDAFACRRTPRMWVLVGEWIKAGEECKDRGDRNKLLCVFFFLASRVARQSKAEAEVQHARGVQHTGNCENEARTMSLQPN